MLDTTKILEAFFIKFSMRQIIFTIFLWGIIYFFYPSVTFIGRLPDLPFIASTYKYSFYLFITSAAIAYSIFNIPFVAGIKKISNYKSLLNYMSQLDKDEIEVINEFFLENTNTISLCPKRDDGTEPLIHKGILIPVNPEDFIKKRTSYFAFYLHPKARKIFKKKYLAK